MEKKRSGEVGFTLVELLVVIAILGILAAIAVFAVGGIRDKGQQSANQTTCSVLQTAEEAYFSQQTPHQYAPDQATLKSAGFLRTTNPAFTIALVAGPPASYTVTGPNCS
jgi:prepilin-type N-terminal cleavage/methylation domain-containing protein